MRTRAPRPPDGGRLRARLITLMLLPLFGMLAIATAHITEHLDRAEAAGQTEVRVRAAGAIDRVRAAFEQEIGPAYVATVARRPALLNTQAPINPEVQRIIGRIPVLRAVTDAAVAALSRQPSVVATGRRLTRELSQARREIDDGVSGAPGQLVRDVIVADLTRVENAEIDGATRSGLVTAARTALADVDRVARAAEAAAAEVELFAASKFGVSSDAAHRRTAWVQAWGRYRAEVGVLTDRGSRDLVTRWNRVAQSPPVARFDAVLAADVAAPVRITISQAIGLMLADGPRDRAYSAVLVVAIARAEDAARSEYDSAMRSLKWLVANGLLLLLTSAGVAVAVGRSVSTPLERLAEQANRISEGQLGEVPISGPREVRTVARALANTVASLNKIEAQAAALAAGDLDNPVVRTPLPGPLGAVMHTSLDLMIRSIREREQAQTELTHRAGHDALTELPNRAQALALIERALHHAQPSRAMTALMFIDLDRFKIVNDRFGHATGDEVLQIVARRLEATIRDGDIPARLGGDEFVVLLQDVDSVADVVSLGHRLGAVLSEEMDGERRAIRIGASIGIGICQDGSADADRLLHEADAAAYQAKNSGRGRVEVYDDTLRARMRSRADLEAAIALGLERDEFVLHYQPVVDLDTGAITAVEALIRWDRPRHGLLAPDRFIPVAEQSALINAIGRWVLREATAQLVRWQQEGTAPAGLEMAVNISGKHLTSGDLVDDILTAVDESGCDIGRLVVELTETVLVDDPAGIHAMRTLRELGVEIAIDDFGTGFTSIGQLPSLPIDCLKIDRSFVASADPAQQQLVRLMVAAAHAFGLTVVAEGVEHEFQAEQLRAARADRGQGYLFARPLPPAQVFPTASSLDRAAPPPVTFTPSRRSRPRSAFHRPGGLAPRPRADGPFAGSDGPL